jgi:hypothetical protein
MVLHSQFILSRDAWPLCSTPLSLHSFRVLLPQQLVRHNVLRQQVHAHLIIPPQRTNTAKRKVRQYPKELPHNQTNISRRLQVYSGVWPYGPPFILVATQPYPAIKLCLQYLSKTSSNEHHYERLPQQSNSDLFKRRRRTHCLGRQNNRQHLQLTPLSRK